MTDTKDTQENTHEHNMPEEEAIDTQDTRKEETPEVTDDVQLAQQRDEYLAGWQRAQADMVNLKKRHDQEKKVFTSLGKEQLLADLIPMLDNFEAAFGNKEAWESVDANWRTGIEYIYSQFQAVLRDNGVEQFGEEGDTFDQHLHEAIEQEGEGTQVTSVMQKGYKIGDRVIRPAKVKLG